MVADGASNDDDAVRIGEWITAQGHQDWITFLPLTMNGGFGWAHNQVILRAMNWTCAPAFIHFLNPDTIVEPGSIAALRKAFEGEPDIGCVGSQMINGQGGLQPAGFRLASVRTEFARGAHTDILVCLLLAKHTVIEAGGDAKEVEAVSGASFMIRTAALRDAGLFDTGFFLYSEEFEWMKRFRAHGWKIAHEPNSRVHHVGGAATMLSRDHKVLARSARPFYWYQSQRRYLYRTLGATRARLAGLAWFVGYLFIAWPRAILSRESRSRLVKNEGRDMLRAWVAGDRFDRQAFAPFPGDPIDEPPAWMTR